MNRSLLLAALATTAIAAAPAAAQTADWTGGYVGGQIGYSFQPSDSNERIVFDTNLDGSFGDQVNNAAGANAFSPGFCGGVARGSTPAAGCRKDRDRVEFGVHAGYDYQMDQFVLGGVVEYARTNIRDGVTAYSTTPAFYSFERRLRDTAGLRLRAGLATGETLFYGTGGLAYGKVRNRFTTSNTANTFTDTGNDDAWGYKLGGGIEQKFSPNFSVGLQYLYTSLKDDDYRVRAGGAAGTPFTTVNAAGTDFARTSDRFTYHSVQLTGSFRF